jgi:hypothetical protein
MVRVGKFPSFLPIGTTANNHEHFLSRCFPLRGGRGGAGQNPGDCARPIGARGEFLAKGAFDSAPERMEMTSPCGEVIEVVTDRKKRGVFDSGRAVPAPLI